MPDAQPSLAGSPAARSGAARSYPLLRLALLAQVCWLEPGCLPQEKLSSYSRAWTDGPAERTPDAATDVSPALDASAGTGGTAGNGAGTSTGGSAGAGGSGGLADASAPSGGVPDASAEPTALDAGLAEPDGGGIPLTTTPTDASSAPVEP